MDPRRGIGLGLIGLGIGVGLSMDEDQWNTVLRNFQNTRWQFLLQAGDSEKAPTYSLIASATMLPHPAKKEGEDACFVKVDENGGGVIGVADGVGGYNELGIDPGQYARMLAFNSAKAHPKLLGNPQAVMASAQNATFLLGAATLCIVEVGERLRAANLGDSGFRVVRGGNVILGSPPLQHAFNFPFQLSCPSVSKSADTANDADTFDFPIQQGDVVVAGSDGLFDNVFDKDIAKVATSCMNRSNTLSATRAASQALVKLARTHAEDRTYISPFALELEKSSKGVHRIKGGKMDDISVIVGKVVKTAEAASDLKEAAMESRRWAEDAKAKVQDAMAAQVDLQERMRMLKASEAYQAKLRMMAAQSASEKRQAQRQQLNAFSEDTSAVSSSGLSDFATDLDEPGPLPSPA